METSNKGARHITFMIVLAAIATFAVAALVINIFERRQEARNPFYRVVELNDTISDPAIWGKDFPTQYDLYLRTVDMERTKYGGSEAMPHSPTQADPRSVVARSKLEQDPRLKIMWAGYAFSHDYRERRGHAYMLQDQTFTERQQFNPPGACLTCHASMVTVYNQLGNGDKLKGFQLPAQGEPILPDLPSLPGRRDEGPGGGYPGPLFQAAQHCVGRTHGFDQRHQGQQGQSNSGTAGQSPRLSATVHDRFHHLGKFHGFPRSAGGDAHSRRHDQSLPLRSNRAARRRGKDRLRLERLVSGKELRCVIPVLSFNHHCSVHHLALSQHSVLECKSQFRVPASIEIDAITATAMPIVDWLSERGQKIASAVPCLCEPD